MDFCAFFDQLYDKNEGLFANDFSHGAKIVGVYIFYRYFNGDAADFDRIESVLVDHQVKELNLTAILPSCSLDGNAVDFLVNASSSSFSRFSINDWLNYGKLLIERVRDIAVKNSGNIKYEALFQEASKGSVFDDSTLYTIRFVTDYVPSNQFKADLQNAFSGLETINGKIVVDITFGDDIEQEIDDVDSPKEFVSNGRLSLFPGASFCNIGNEGSFITIVSASSLKRLYFDYSTKGLFASNLRFFIGSKKIDPLIKSTITESPDNFVYYNNGIIITCDDVMIQDESLVLKNFSIVNGGQTTNLIGRTNFIRDFGIVCKVIKNRYHDLETKTHFLSMVAEASNTQKPINAKDIIANKPEQRMLKIQFADAGMFLSVKRGEKINKTLYPEPWQNATNDKIAQLVFSSVYQSPCLSKNSKSTILSRDSIYKTIFASKYNSYFFLSLQHFRVSFSNWVKFVGKSEGGGSTKYGLAKNADLMIVAVIGLFLKVMTNQKLRNEFLHLSYFEWNYDNFNFKVNLQQNDIGKISLISPDLFNVISTKTLFPVFEFCFSEIMIPAYSSFKKDFRIIFIPTLLKVSHIIGIS